MLGRIGIQGEIRCFNLYDEQRGNFEVVSENLEEYTVEGTEKIISGYISQCYFCKKLRCILINEKDMSWECMKCGRKGKKKPEESRESDQKKVRKSLLKEKKE